MSCPTSSGDVEDEERPNTNGVESVVAGGSRKRGDPCPEDRTTQGWVYVTVKLHSKLLKVIVYDI